MKNITPQSTEQCFTLYRDNRLDKKYSISPFELHNGILDWLYKLDRMWIEQTPNQLIVAKYLSEQLNSSWETEDLEKITNLLKTAFKKYHDNWC